MQSDFRPLHEFRKYLPVPLCGIRAFNLNPLRKIDFHLIDGISLHNFYPVIYSDEFYGVAFAYVYLQH